MRLPLIPPADLTPEQRALYNDMCEGITRNFKGFIAVRVRGAKPWARLLAWQIDSPASGRFLRRLISDSVARCRHPPILMDCPPPS